MEGIKKEIGVLTQSKSIPYEVLKYLGYSHNIVNLMWGLWTKTRDTYMAMRASNYFESMMQTIELDEIKLKFLYFQEGNKPVCTKDLEWRDWEKYTGSIPWEVNPIVKFWRSQLIWIKVKLRIDSISPIRCSDAWDRGLLNMILWLPCVTEIRWNSTFFDDLANQYNFVLDGLIEKNKRYDFGWSVKIDNDAKIPIKYFSWIRQLEYPSVKTGSFLIFKIYPQLIKNNMKE